MIAFTGNTLTITPATLAVTASPETKVYGQSDPTLAYAASGYQFSDDGATVLSGGLTRAAGETVDGGPYAIAQGTLTANDNYTIVFTGNTLTITPATLTVTASPESKVYGHSDPTLAYAASGFQFSDNRATVLSGGLVRATGETVDGGPYAIAQGTLTANDNYTIAFTGNTLTITPATLTVTANPETKVYGQSDPTLAYAASGYQFSDDGATVLTGGLTRAAGETVDGGPYAIAQGTLTANDNYTIAFAGNTLTITPATLAVTASPETKVYGHSDPTLAYAASGFQFSDNRATVLSGGLVRATGETVDGGPYAIAQGTLTANDNYTIAFTGNTLTITPATLTVTASPETKVYGHSDPTLAYAASGFQFSDDGATVLTGGLTRAAGETVDGGPYGISQGTLAANDNYKLAFTGNTLTITPATLTVAASPESKVYGHSDPTLAYAASGYQFSDDGATVLTGGLTRAAGETVDGGPYTIAQGTLTANDNYTIAFTGNTLTITPATPTVSVTDASGTYTSSAFSATGAVTGVGNASLGTPAFTYYSGTYTLAQLNGLPVLANVPVDVGHYTVLASYTAASDYTSANAVATFTISQKNVILTTQNAGKFYGQSDPSPLTAANLSGFYSGDGITATFSRQSGESVGTYPITTTLVGPSVKLGDYDVTNAGATFTISAVPAVTAVSSPASGAYAAGTTIPITITFSEAVTVTGTPQLALNTGSGAAANYTSGSGSPTLTFIYTVAAGQTTSDLDYTSITALGLNSGTITNAARRCGDVDVAGDRHGWAGGEGHRRGAALRRLRDGKFSTWPWQLSSAGTSPANWTVESSVVHAGSYAAQSGAIGASSSSTLSVTLTVAAGELSFWRKVSSASGSGLSDLRDRRRIPRLNCPARHFGSSRSIAFPPGNTPSPGSMPRTRARRRAAMPPGWMTSNSRPARPSPSMARRATISSASMPAGQR